MRSVDDSTTVLNRVSILVMGLILSSFVLRASPAVAFVGSDDDQWATDVREAKSRAADFQRYERDAARAEIERQSEAHLVSEARVKAEAEDEKIQEEFAKKQPDIDAVEAEQEKDQIAFDQQKAKEEQEMENERKNYVAKRDHYREVLEKEAYIDEAEEYGLKGDEGGVENNQDSGNESSAGSAAGD